MAVKKSSGNLKKFFTDKKYRPFVMGGVIIIGAIILISLLGKKGGASTATSGPVATGPSEQAQLAMAQISAGLQVAQGEQQANFAIANLGAQLQAAEIAATTSLRQQELEASERMQVRGLEAERIRTEQEIALASKQLDSQTQLELANIEADKFQQAQMAEMFFGQQSLEAARIAGQYDLAAMQIGAERDVALEHEKSIQIGLGRAKKKHISAILAGESAQLGTKASAIGGALGGVLGFLSDLRVKKDVEWSGVYDGVNYYQYKEKATGAVRAGVMAQEVGPQYHIPMGGNMGVDYIALEAQSA